MKRISTVLFVLFIALISVRAEDKAPATTFSLSMGQDPIFGFYPSFAGSIALSETMQFTAYGIFWTADALGGNYGGLNLLTEFGAGLNFTMAEGKLNINPQIGLAHGNYQSGGGDHVLADNIVPSLGIYYGEGDFYMSFNAIYWKGLRKEAKVTPYYDMIEYTLQPSIALSPNFGIGLYFDHLLTKADYEDYNIAHPEEKGKTETTTTYLWVGPSLKFTFSKGINCMFSFGADFAQYLNDATKDDAKIMEYYKLVLNIPF